jgi:hypothetical protein
MSSNDSVNSSFIGKIVDIGLEASALKAGATDVLLQLAKGSVSPLTISTSTNISLSAHQLQMAQFNPIVINPSAGATHVILVPGTAVAAGSDAAVFLCESLGLAQAGDTARLLFADVLQATTVVLAGTSDTIVLGKIGSSSALVTATSVGTTTASVSISAAYGV